jgi:hypothetical protein
MVDGKLQLVCERCGESYGKPWYALISICSELTNTDFSWELCERCYAQIRQALLQAMARRIPIQTAVRKPPTLA